MPRLHVLPALLAIAVATLACLMPVHNDTWWHLRAGLEQWRQGAPLFVDTFSYTAAGGFFWNHSWLSQVLFYGVYRLGGLPLLTAACAAMVAFGWAVAWRMLRGPTTDRALLFALALAGSTTIWSVRPQVASVALFPLVVLLISRDRWRPVPWIVALWANLHAGVGVVVMPVAAAIGAAVLSDRGQLPQRAAWGAATLAATLLTPLGIRNWTEVAASMERSRANVIQEWMPTALPPQEIFFWGAATALVWMAVRQVRWGQSPALRNGDSPHRDGDSPHRFRWLERPDDRVLVLLALLMLPVAVRALRNVPAFMMVAAPALSRLLHPAGHAARPLSGRRNAAAPAVVAAALLLAVAVVWRAWSAPWPMLGWRPMSQGAAAAISRCPGRLYNTYEGGGPIVWFAPAQPVMVDSRQDPFPSSLVQAVTRVEAGGPHEALFTGHGVNCAAVPPGAPVAERLREHGWQERYRDGQWLVLVRPGAAPAAPPSPAP